MKINWQAISPRMIKCRWHWLEYDWIHYIIINEMIEHWIREYPEGEIMEKYNYEGLSEYKRKQLHKKEVRDMNRCPDCHKKPERTRKQGDDCDNLTDMCESQVVLYRGHLEWRNPNWG